MLTNLDISNTYFNFVIFAIHFEFAVLSMISVSLLLFVNVSLTFPYCVFVRLRCSSIIFLNQDKTNYSCGK